MPVGIQVFNAQGELVYDSNNTPIFYVAMHLSMPKEAWAIAQINGKLTATYSVTGLDPAKHVCMRLLGRSGKLCCPVVIPNGLRLTGLTAVGVIAGAAAGTIFTVAVMRF